MEKTEIQKEMDKVMSELEQFIFSLDQEQIDRVPFEGSWTAGQLVRHVLLSGTGFVQLLNGPVRETGRAPDEMVASIKRDFLDFSIKMQSPDILRPAQKSYGKERLLRSIENLRTSIGTAIENLDLSQTCLAFELPVYGFLTRLEAVYFVLYHTQRHVRQLKHICDRIRP